MSETIETYEQFYKRLMSQKTPFPHEREIFMRIFNEELSMRNGELSWAIMKVYLAGKVKGAGIITHDGMNRIAENMIENKESHSAENTAALA